MSEAELAYKSDVKMLMTAAQPPVAGYVRCLIMSNIQLKSHNI